MSNLQTAAFIEVLVVAGMETASNDWERALVYWLIEHDQTRIGLGVVGFDVADLGWSEPGFAEQRRFVLGLIDAALARRGWGRLNYKPREETIFEVLRQFRAMVSAVTEPVAPTSKWIPGEQPSHGVCSKCGVYLHESGCIICDG